MTEIISIMEMSDHYIIGNEYYVIFAVLCL